MPEEQHADQDKCRGNGIPDKVHPMDALTATEPGVFVLDIKTIPALFHLTNQPRHKFLNLLLEIARLFTLIGVPPYWQKEREEPQKSFLSIVRNHDIAQSNTDAQPMNRQIRGKCCKHAQEQIQQKQRQNINLFRPQRWPVPIRF